MLCCIPTKGERGEKKMAAAAELLSRKRLRQGDNFFEDIETAAAAVVVANIEWQSTIDNRRRQRQHNDNDGGHVRLIYVRQERETSSSPSGNRTDENLSPPEYTHFTPA